ncbi:hypothetical protein K458DRAFT_210405 [Lentithecium fluviatile CBS 122367]|uniref:Zn(2)-C6 fungal-type domain-containing protein n=1 Tax=Lentithecium fluviatile CBS 122367 TaxID=1168545 RepID=A0A6G1J6V8_9PLEO|nr:hypothetical protein K458DRAFT_210405 [Lentithecium fluviatile CBS 122367]
MQAEGRLPVNPRRRKVAPENRKRVARACNGCNVRRVKCSGDQPCQQCVSGSRNCVYPTAEASKEATLKSEVDRLRKRCTALEQSLQSLVPDETARREFLSKMDYVKSPPPLPNTPSHAEATYADEAEATEGRLLFDIDGNVRFLGETSGATFLDLLKHFMLTLVPLTFAPGPGLTAPEDGSIFVASIGQYQTFDSRPLKDPGELVDPLWLPSRTEMTLMLAELCYHIQHGNGDFASGGIYYWGDINNVPAAVTLAPSQFDAINSDSYRYLAFHHVCFALASQIATPTLQHEEDPGNAYFKRARMLIGNPLDTVRFTLRDVPVLALMGFYLIELNRRDAAYLYVSLAIHIAITHGAFRHYVDEGSKRIFWTLYVLDRWLSCLMGRPPTLIEEAIRLPLPADVPSMPPCAGLLAHVQLARISGYVVCETFKIAPREQKATGLTHDIDKAMDMLKEWLVNLPLTLQMSPDALSIDPPCCTLHMAYNQLVLVATRPIFLVAVKRAVAERYIQSGNWRLEKHPQYKHIQACSAAAHYNICLAQWMVQLYSSRRLLQAGLHFVFNAAVILLLNRILRAYSGAVDAEISFAIELFAKEAEIGSNYQRDCHQVLKDLKTLIDRFLSPEKPDVFSHGYDVANSQPSSASSFGLGAPAHLHDARGRQHWPIEGDDVYQELLTWMQNDDSQLYNTFRI